MPSHDRRHFPPVDVGPKLRVMSLSRWILIARFFMSAWVLFVVPSVVQILQSGVGPAQIGLAAALGGWMVVWVWFWLRAIDVPRLRALGFVAITVILALLALFTPGPVGVGGVMVFAFIVAGIAFPWRRAVWIQAGLAVLQVMLQTVRLEDPAIQVSGLLNSVLVGGVGVGVRLLWLSYNELLAARDEIARMAVNEERLRFARDIHDTLGQSLAMIVLKGELVARNLPAGTDASIKQEVYDVVGVARKSLNDVREAVTGYRTPTLPGEISSARAALRSAGIAFVVTDQLGTVPPEKDAVLAWCLREAVTNVVKHSGAARCDLRLSRENGQVLMSVTDDGRGSSTLNGGSGIAGMRERVELAGGTVNIHSNGGLQVLVTVPAA